MTFEYQDEHRRTLFRVVRTARKRFWQQRPDGAGGWQNGIAAVRRVLYRLPELLAADPDMPVYIPEGEKHVDALLASGRVATCNPGGAGKWRDDYAEARRAAGLSEGTLCRSKARLDIRSVRHGFGKGATYAWQLGPATTMDGQAAPRMEHLAVHGQRAAGTPELTQASP